MPTFDPSQPHALSHLLHGVMAAALAGCVGSTSSAITDDTGTTGLNDTGPTGDDTGPAGDDTGDDTIATAGETATTLVDTGPGGDDTTPTVVDTGTTGSDTTPTVVDTTPTLLDTMPTTPTVPDTHATLPDTTPTLVDTAACADDPFPPLQTGSAGDTWFGPDDALALSGCDWPPGHRYAVPSCGPQGWNPLDGLQATVALTDLVLVKASAPGGDTGSYRFAYRWGNVCGDAADVTTCEDAIDAVRMGSAADKSIVTTTGGTVQVWTTTAEVEALLGTIDGPADALLRAWHATPPSTWMPICAGGRGGEGRAAVGGGWQVVMLRTASSCPQWDQRLRFHVATDGTVTEEARQVYDITSLCVGRRPPGLSGATAAHGDVGAVLARHAALEAASVHAFDHLHRELAALGAPDGLLRRVRKAARDETRHAAQVGALARRHGHPPDTPTVEATPLRDAFAIALDNAVEGCVGETWGALVGMWQAEHATDPAVAATMRRVARDEVRHAALSWAIDAWLAERLTVEERAQVVQARREAAAQLGEGEDLAAGALGLPTGKAREALIAGLTPAIA